MITKVATGGTLCRDCLATEIGRGLDRCRTCGSPRVVRHDELFALSVAHIDCDAFYASVEKRDDPSLADKPLIIGGGRRGVVSTACYIARINGVHSAMPMFKALKACPDAVVLKPNMAKYSAVSKEIRQLMLELTPLVEPISIDEAFLDLSGTERLHHASPAASLARLASRIETEIGVTASIGLSFNKFLAKVASDQDKPRGFSTIGRAEAVSFLARQPVSLIPGVGKTTMRNLERDGLKTIADIQARSEKELATRYGSQGLRLARLAFGRDTRKVSTDGQMKSVSSETTFNTDISAYDDLAGILWKLSERVSERLKKKEIGGSVVTLKLKTAEFRVLTRRTSLETPTQLADRIFEASSPLLKGETRQRRSYRLIGVGLSGLVPADTCDLRALFGDGREKHADAERALDRVRARFGTDLISRGRGFAPRPRTEKP